MEEKNKKKRMLYVLLGAVALLIVLVGGTYAYFSASVSNSNTIGGNTQNINNNSLTLTVKKVVFNGTSAPSNDLVPAYFGATNNELNVSAPSELGLTQVSSMLTHKCEQDGFTGCHVYQINISADQNITHANLLLNLSVSNLNGASSIENKNQWGYVVFQADGTVDSSTGATSGLTNPVLNTNNGAPAAIGNGVTNLDIHNDSTLSSTVVTYYLLVYLNDTGASQNNVVSNSGDANYAVGSYSGTLELQALGGKVRACFTPNGACEVEVPNGTLKSRMVFYRSEEDENDDGIIDDNDGHYDFDETVFGQMINPMFINKIYTVNHTSVPANAVNSWDASEEQNGSVMAWVTPGSGDNYCVIRSRANTDNPVDSFYNKEYCDANVDLYDDLYSCGDNDICIAGKLYELYIGQVGGVKAPSNSRELFEGYSLASVMDLSNLDTSNVTDMSYMFRGCSSLTSLNLSNFNTSNVTNMIEMFRGCSSLTTLDLSSFDFSAAAATLTGMASIFDGMSSLTSMTCKAEDESLICDTLNNSIDVAVNPVSVNGNRQCGGPPTGAVS